MTSLVNHVIEIARGCVASGDLGRIGKDWLGIRLIHCHTKLHTILCIHMPLRVLHDNYRLFEYTSSFMMRHLLIQTLHPITRPH